MVFRILGRCFAYLCVVTLATVAANLTEQATGTNVRFMAGWVTAFAFLWIFPSARFWDAGK